MKYGKVETEKLYFSSNEAAELVGVTVDTLRSWEKQFPDLNPEKNRAGKRTYRQSDIEIAKRIKEEQSQGTLFKDCEVKAEAKPKSTRKNAKPSTASGNQDSLLKIRDSIKSALNKIKG